MADTLGTRYPIFFSTQTRLAMLINSVYYNERSFVWCTPFFDGVLPMGGSMPQTSSPLRLARSWAAIAAGGDVGPMPSVPEKFRPKGAKVPGAVQSHRAGLKTGVTAKRKGNVINDETRDQLVEVIDHMQAAMFSPLLLLIPGSVVAERATASSPLHHSHNVSIETCITDLAPGEFECFDLLSRSCPLSLTA